MSKKLVYLLAGIGGTLGGYIGSVIDNGNFLGLWGLILSTAGGLAGIFIAYKLQ